MRRKIVFVAPLFALFALSLAACAPSNISLRDMLAARASFDLSCPKDKLTYVPFSENDMWVTSYGVVGCGQRAVYLLQSGPTWSLDARSEDATSPTTTKSLTPEIPAAPPPPPPPPPPQDSASPPARP